ncbi:MAG: DUF4417 domain-containing protein [Clostridia bacterium]|nr:DUF4417 domain-containing protein [Clostridia bacterium]
MKNKILKKETSARGFKDTFNIHRVKDLKLVGDLEIPYISKYVGPIPKKIINVLRHPSNPELYFVHHYLFDYTFDGRNGFWYGCMEDSIREKAYLCKMKQYQGIISPDYSIYIDLPFAHQIWNIYRDRVTCMWLRSLGLNVVFNVRWGDYRTYKIVFQGIEKHSVLAVGSHGLIKHPENRTIFMSGFKEMIRRLEPSTLIIYGPYTNEMREQCEKNNVQVVHFVAEQVEARKGEQ